jgi:hypothetical protein
MAMRASLFMLLLAAGVGTVRAQDPPALNPFAPQAPKRAEEVPGYLELSDGTVRPGHLYLTRDARLKIFDVQKQSHRDIPLSALRRIDCKVERAWMEKEWRFKENASDEKLYTGHTYPAREYSHTLTLLDGSKIEGPLSAIVYVRQEDKAAAERFLLHKRDKGRRDSDLPSLLYVRSIQLGEEALREGREKAAQKSRKPGKR